jgi:predicted nucleotidyltransferase
MDAFGFREALATAVQARFPTDVDAPVVSLPGLAVLKLVAWRDRHLRAPRKDAHDLMVISSNYLRLGNESRLWDEFVHWTEQPAFDYRVSGARMLGRDMRAMLTGEAVHRVAALLGEQIRGRARGGELALEMNVADPPDAETLLRGMFDGFTESPEP